MSRAVLLWLALQTAACGSRSGLLSPEADATDGGTSPNTLCVERPPTEIVNLLTAEMQPAHIGVSGNRLVVAEWPFTGDVFRMPKTGGSISDVLSDSEASVNRLIADAGSAYWVVQGFGNTDGALRGANSSAKKASTVVASLTRPKGVAAFGDFLYFTDGIGPPMDSSNGRVLRVKRGSNQATVLASSLADPWAIAVDATGLYFTDGGGVFALPLTGGVPEQLTFTGGLLTHLATDGKRLYWSDVAGSVFQRDHASGTVLELASGLGSIEGIAADAAGAYLVQRAAPSDVATGTVQAIRGDGLVLLATTDDAPMGLALDSSAIYFVAINGAQGSVNLLCRAP